MKIEIIENSSRKITVRATLPTRDLNRDPELSIDTDDIRNFLKEENINVADLDCVKKTTLNNFSKNLRLDGTWEFVKLSKPAPAPKNKTRASRQKKRKVSVNTNSKPVTTDERKEDKLFGIQNLE